jgi:hypothetical protein
MVGIPSKRKICQKVAGLFEPCSSKGKRRVTPVAGIRITLPEAQTFRKKAGNHANYKRKTAVALFFLGPRIPGTYTFCRIGFSVR